MKTIGLIPLDSRPCNTLWLKQLAKIAGYQLLMYPRNKCGDLFKAADFKNQIEWLKINAKAFDYLIISMDGLTSGGLIQTRTGNANLELIKEHHNFLKDIKKINPEIKIYVFDTLMRTSITTLSNETAKYWRLVNEFSRLVGEIHFHNRGADKEALENIKSQLPNELIESYLSARKKKNTINKLSINYVKQGLVDYLIILQEDAMPNGIQKIEQIELMNLIDAYKLNKAISFYNGTDEGALILYGRAILYDQKLNPNIHIHLPYIGALNKIMLFEDRPFINNLTLMFETLNFNFTSIDKADFVLSIYTEKENIDLDLNTSSPVLPTYSNIYFNYLNELNNLIELKPTYFVDLLFPNGGSSEILKQINYHKLKGYSAWNTASNAMGSALAHIASILVAKNKKLDYYNLSTAFTKERIIDDCLYQYHIRRAVNEKLLANDINIYNLGSASSKVTEEVSSSLKQLAKEYLDDEFHVKLPWKRTFEAEIILKGEHYEKI